MNPVLLAALLGLAWSVPVTVLVYLLLRAQVTRERSQIEGDRQQLETEAAARMLEAKEEALNLRESVEDELRKRRSDLELGEARLKAREEAIKAQEAEIPAREQALNEAERGIKDRLTQVDLVIERAAGLSVQEAVQQVIARAEHESTAAAAKSAADIEREAVETAERKAKQVILDAIQRLATDYIIEASTAVISLPSEDFKGRLIGREGRNIRTFEQVTGVDLIIDETPDTVVVSSFDPVRREIARLTVMNMMLDGRIHPGRIEEIYQKATAEVEQTVRDAGERAAERAGVAGIPVAIVQSLGRLRFRASYAQNVLDHSVEVAELSSLLAQEVSANVEVAKRAGLLHDIGKALGSEWDGPHAIAGMNFLRSHGEKESVCLAVGAHHREIEPESPESQIVLVADAISAARPGARRENLDQYVKRLAQLEEIATSFPGVERAFAIQAGREVRVIVRPNEIDDNAASKLAEQVAKKIEGELEYPGQIKVTVIRETRVQQIAK